MQIEYDETKRVENRAKHGLDFEHAREVFALPTYDMNRVHELSGELRVVSIGWWRGRMVMVVWTQRGPARRIISMRKCNAKEQDVYAPRF